VSHHLRGVIRMCGRFTLRANLHRIFQELAVDPQANFDWPPRYNIAPTQQVLTVSLLDGKRQLLPRRWGLVPFWAKDAKIGHSLINARAETVADKPAFRNSFKKDRCLVVANGFYEWKKIDGKKQPYFIRMRDDRPFALAGLAAYWDKEGTIDSATIITTDEVTLLFGNCRCSIASHGRLLVDRRLLDCHSPYHRGYWLASLLPWEEDIRNTDSPQQESS
jgi:putative SOS response-associated peptidase YedK